jgi:hypothetical protein
MLPKVMVGLDKRAAADVVPTAQERASAIATIPTEGSAPALGVRLFNLKYLRYRDHLQFKCEN